MAPGVGGGALPPPPFMPPVLVATRSRRAPGGPTRLGTLPEIPDGRPEPPPASVSLPGPARAVPAAAGLLGAALSGGARCLFV